MSGERLTSWPKWALYLAFLVAFPVPFYMFVVGGVVPMFYILYLAGLGIIVALPKLRADGFFMFGILSVHAAVLGGLLYLGAVGICRILFRVFSKRHAAAVVLVLICALFAAAAIFEIYRIPGHNFAPPANIFRFIAAFAG